MSFKSSLFVAALAIIFCSQLISCDRVYLIVGPREAGKSTVVNQICGFYTAEEGNIKKKSFTKNFTAHACASPDFKFKNITFIDTPTFIDDFALGRFTTEQLRDQLAQQIALLGANDYLDGIIVAATFFHPNVIEKMRLFLIDTFGPHVIESTMWLLTMGNKIKFWDKKDTVMEPYWEECREHGLKCQYFETNNEHALSIHNVNIQVKEWGAQMKELNTHLLTLKKLDIEEVKAKRAAIVNEATKRFEAVKNDKLRKEKWFCPLSGKILKAYFGNRANLDPFVDFEKRIWKTQVEITSSKLDIVNKTLSSWSCEREQDPIASTQQVKLDDIIFEVGLEKTDWKDLPRTDPKRLKFTEEL